MNFHNLFKKHSLTHNKTTALCHLCTSEGNFKFNNVLAQGTCLGLWRQYWKDRILEQESFGAGVPVESHKEGGG